MKRRAAGVSASVKWENYMVVPKDGDNPDEAGIVAGFLVVTRSLKFRIRAAPAQLQTILTLNSKIEQDVTAEGDEDGDRRRIVHLFMTLVDKRPPIHFAHPRANQGRNEGAVEQNN